MMDPVRRTILTTGAAATALAAAPRAFAREAAKGEAEKGEVMGVFEKGAVRIHFEEAGSGFPLLLIAGGGLHSTLAGFTRASSPFDPVVVVEGQDTCSASR